MKVTFVYPRFEKFLESIPDLNLNLIDHFIGNFSTPPSLGIPILAALTPPEWDKELVDDNNGDEVVFDAQTDLVAINCFTPQATRAFELADGYRRAGKTVVMGGFFPSTMPEEAARHADAVCIGDGEPVWREILNDVASGRLKRKYVGGTRFDLTEMPIPDRDLFYEKTGYDWNEDLVQTARGCTYNCGMCSIPGHQGHRIRLRPVDKVVEEIGRLKYDNVYLAEDLLFFPNRKVERWSRDLFRALAPLGKNYFVSSTMSFNTSRDLLDLLAEAGVNCFYCTLNTDQRSMRALEGDASAVRELTDLVHALEDRGIRFFASFGMGRDWDGPELADSILDLCSKARIRTAEFFLFTPYPGSSSWSRMERQERILHREWRMYNGAHVVARPLSMEIDTLYRMFTTVWREFYSKQSCDETVKNLEPERSDEHMKRRRNRAGLRSKGS